MGDKASSTPNSSAFEASSACVSKMETGEKNHEKISGGWMKIDKHWWDVFCRCFSEGLPQQPAHQLAWWELTDEIWWRYIICSWKLMNMNLTVDKIRWNTLAKNDRVCWRIMLMKFGESSIFFWTNPLRSRKVLRIFKDWAAIRLTWQSLIGVYEAMSIKPWVEPIFPQQNDPQMVPSRIKYGVWCLIPSSKLAELSKIAHELAHL